VIGSSTSKLIEIRIYVPPGGGGGGEYGCDGKVPYVVDRRLGIKFCLLLVFIFTTILIGWNY